MIHIYKADYNFLVRVIQRKAIQHAQQMGKINQKQYGECLGRECTSVTYLEEIRRDISILTWESYANFDDNSAFYYNQILMSVASLSRKKYGVNKKIVYVNAATLKEAKCKLKLSLKTSNTSYRHYKKFSIQQTSKVRILTLMIWCFVSTILFDCHNQKTPGLTAASPYGDVIVSLASLGMLRILLV